MLRIRHFVLPVIAVSIFHSLGCSDDSTDSAIIPKTEKDANPTTGENPATIGEAVKPHKTECLALFKQVLTTIQSEEMEKAFVHIVDGSPSTFKIWSDEEIELFKNQDEAKFRAKNFPRYNQILTNYDRIQFGDVAHSGKKLYKIKRDDEVIGQSSLFTIPVKMPFLTQKETGADELSAYSQLRFVKVDKKLYWVPFGW